MMFTTSRHLGFGDCDPAGIAFFPSYFRLLVGVVEELFERIGAPWPTVVRDRRIGVPTVKLDVDFTAPAFHGDRLDFTTVINALGGSSADLRHHVAVAGRTVWTARQVLVATSLDTHRAIRWPDDIRAGLATLLETTNEHNPAT